jgi:CRP-like cAMP-binding protein
MSKDGRALREEAAAATAAGKHRKALAAYLELERLEPRDAQWAKRAAEVYRRLGKDGDAIDAYERSADRYAQNGFLVQAIAVCKLILQIDPEHAGTLRRLAQINELIGTTSTRAGALAENNPTLYDDPNVSAIRRSNSVPPPIEDPPRRQKISSNPPINVARTRSPASVPPLNVARTKTPPSSPPVTVARTKSPPSIPPINVARTKSPPYLERSGERAGPMVARTKSRPIVISPGSALDSVDLGAAVPGSHARDKSNPSVRVIPIDVYMESLDFDAEDATTESIEDSDFEPTEDRPRDLNPVVVSDDAGLQPRDSESSLISIDIEVETSDPIDVHAADVHESTEVELSDLDEIPLPAPRAIGVRAQRALADTPLFAGLPSEALEALVEHMQLIPLLPGAVLFHQGDPGDSLYVITEGELAVQGQGVEMSRLGPGAFIGEVALMTDQPRSATVTAAAPSELLRIDRQTLASVLANHGDLLPAVLRFVRDRLVDRWIRTSPMFRPFDEDERAELMAKFTFLEIDQDTVLLDVGEHPDGLYIVLAGAFIVRRNNEVVATLGPGELIGETALLSGGAFRSQVVAKGKSLALCLPAPVFRALIMTHPHMLEYVGEHAEQSRRLQIL